eukprot:m.79063 g.79063  ORF g.79063 m.79063 type:complete len:103 (+) comp25176_c0_seq1:1189-1497(+)
MTFGGFFWESVDTFEMVLVFIYFSAQYKCVQMCSKILIARKSQSFLWLGQQHECCTTTRLTMTHTLFQKGKQINTGTNGVVNEKEARTHSTSHNPNHNKQHN